MSEQQLSSQPSEQPDLFPLAKEEEPAVVAEPPPPVTNKPVIDAFQATLDAYVSAVSSQDERKSAGIKQLMQEMFFNSKMQELLNPYKRPAASRAYAEPPSKRAHLQVPRERYIGEELDHPEDTYDSQFDGIEDDWLEDRMAYKQKQQVKREQSPVSAFSQRVTPPPSQLKKPENVTQVLLFSEHSYVKNPAYTGQVPVESVSSRNMLSGGNSSKGSEVVQKETAPVSAACYYVTEQDNELLTFGSPKEGMTKNRALMYMVIHYLGKIAKPGATIQMIGDNDYVLDSMARKTVYRWREEGWGGRANSDMWQLLLAALEKHEASGGRVVWFHMDAEACCNAFEDYTTCRRIVLAEVREIQERYGGRVPFKPTGNGDYPRNNYNGGNYNGGGYKSNYNNGGGNYKKPYKPFGYGSDY